MGPRQIFLAVTSSLLLAAAVGCAHNYPPPPPPPPAGQMPPLIALAEHNGHDIGRRDGEAAAAAGYPATPRRTPAYHNTPGYDPQLGPFGAYQNAFRNAYLRSYDRGYRHVADE